MKSIKEAGDLKDKKVLVRVDWSVPIENGKVTNDYQIKKTFPTLEYLSSQGAKVIIATHMENDNDSVEVLREYVPAGMELLENLRNNPGEKNNDIDFAKYLAGKADIYVNEAFAVSHRKHASVVGVPEFLPSYVGLSFIEEVEALSKAFNPPHPFLLIIGGAKFETKIPLIEKFLNIADEIFIAGAIAKPAFDAGLGNNAKIVFPLGDIAALDADEANLNLMKEKIENSRFIVWNGPLGKYEEGYTQGTIGLTKILAESNKEVIIGGGDTLAVIKHLEVKLPSGSLTSLFDKFTYVSTGGGAMLEFLATGTLSGIEALD